MCSISTGATPAPGAVVASVLSDTRFGFVTMERAGAGWQLNRFGSHPSFDDFGDDSKP